jgi:hypothetical protein
MKITRDLLVAYAMAEDLDDETRLAIEAHLKRSPEDRRLVEDYETIEWALKQPLFLVEGSTALPAAILSTNGHLDHLMEQTSMPHLLELESFNRRTQAHRRSGNRRLILAVTASSMIGALAFAGADKIGALKWLGAPQRAIDQSRPADPPKAPALVAALQDPPKTAVSPLPSQERGPVDQARLAQGHVHPGASDILEDGTRRVSVIPEDPFAPTKGFNWYYTYPVHVIKREFITATRELLLMLDFHASDAAVETARGKLALRYKANGRPDVKPQDISINPLQPLGYRVSLRTPDGELILQQHDGRIDPGKTPIAFKIPAERTDLIKMLAEHPDFVALTLTQMIPFGYSISASAEAMNLRSSSMKSRQTLTGGKAPAGPIIVDRQGLEQYVQMMRNEIRSSTISAGLEPQAIEAVIQQLGTMESMTFADFLARPGHYYVWNAETRRLEARPEEYDILKNETLSLDKETSQIKNNCDKISELATHESDEVKFFNHLVDEMSLAAKASGGMTGIFSADLSMDLKTKKDSLNSGETKAVRDYMQKARNKTEFASSHTSESERRFKGQHHLKGTNAKGWDLYLISDETIVGETLYGSRQVKFTEFGTVEISQNLSLEVEAAPGVTFDVASLDGRFGSLQDQITTIQDRAAQAESELKRLKEALTLRPGLGYATQTLILAGSPSEALMLKNNCSIPEYEQAQKFTFQGSEGWTSVFLEDQQTKLPREFGKRIVAVWYSVQGFNHEWARWSTPFKLETNHEKYVAFGTTPPPPPQGQDAGGGLLKVHVLYEK